MSSSMKNIVTTLLVLTFVFAGYYIYAQNKNSDLSLDGQESLTENMLLKTEVFIERSALISSIVIERDIFDNPVFHSYRSFANPLINEPFGRENPFDHSTAR